MNKAMEAQCPAPAVENNKNVYEMLGHLEEQQMGLWERMQGIRGRHNGVAPVEPNVIDANGYFERLIRLIDVNRQLLHMADEFLSYF